MKLIKFVLHTTKNKPIKYLGLTVYQHEEIIKNKYALVVLL